MAEELGMEVRRSTAYSASLADSMNSLLLTGPPRPAVTLNGQRLGSAHRVTSRDGQLLVERQLVYEIRGLLRRTPRRATAGPLLTQMPQWKSITVVLDPGHGGKDPGAVSRFGPQEKQIVLDTAMRVRRILQDNDVQVIMTRSDDVFVELEERAALANRVQADLYVSIHADAAPNPAAKGCTVYVARQASTASTVLARSIISQMDPCALAVRGIRQADFRVLVNTEMPAVLVELGYLTHREEAGQLAQSSYRQDLAAAIAEGILAHARKAF